MKIGTNLRYWFLSFRLYNNCEEKIGVRCSEHHAMKAYWRSGDIAPRIIDLGTRWRWVVSFTPWPLYPQGKSPPYPLDRRLSGPQSRSGHGAEVKNSQPHRDSNSNHSTVQPVVSRYTDWAIHLKITSLLTQLSRIALSGQYWFWLNSQRIIQNRA
jgi:hypothetical protein